MRPSGTGDVHAHAGRSDGRGEISWALVEIVGPVLRHLFRPHEVTGVHVSATADEDGGMTLTLWVDAFGHSGGAVLWDSASTLHGASLTDLRVHAADQLQDMIAESPDAWGELRTFQRSDFE